MIKKVVAIVAVLLVSGMFIEAGNFTPNSKSTATVGFEGVSWTDVVPIKKTVFVGFDEENYLDDYSYLAAIPATTFYKEGHIYSYPLLYFDEQEISTQKELSLNSSQSISYFMEDWLSYCGNFEIELINAPGAKKWDATYSYINSTDVYDVAKQIAVNHWKYNDKCILATAMDVSEEHYVEGEKRLTIANAVTSSFPILIAEPEGIGGVYEEFIIYEPYKYVEVAVEWNPLLRGNDIDLQLFDDAIGMVDASENWNALAGTHEEVESFVFNYGTWEVGLTYMPTEHFGIMKNLSTEIGIKRGREYEADVRLYSGEIIGLPEIQFLAKNVTIDIECNKNVSFGAVLLSPSNIVYEPFEGNEKITMHFDEIGGGNYSLCLFLMENAADLNFVITYEWHEVSREQIDSFASASQAAILASLFDIPLLYVQQDDIPQSTYDAIEELDIEEAYAIGVNDVVVQELERKLIVTAYNLEEAYAEIYALTDSNDVVFTSASPWSYWLAEELRQEGEKEKALYIGPATLAAAHHGCPLFIVEEHTALSQGSSWVTDFWKRDSRAREPPPVACMYLMARQVYDFLDELNIDGEGKENILTIAGQFDIGIGWDRAFVGKSNPGRILGTPVDTSQWVCRSVFYPALIFENPGMSDEGIMLINGSKSERDALGRLHILKPSQLEHATYPVLQTWVSYCHDFNKEASKYWGLEYTCRDGITPYVTPSADPIDEGVTDKLGSYWPDMSTADVVPFYLSKIGYGNVFSTNFSATMNNLNKGVIMWFEGMHAAHFGTGVVGFWDPNANWTQMFYLLQDIPLIGNIIKNKKINTEPNPWRGYEFGLWRQGFFRWGIPFTDVSTEFLQTGSTADPDVMVMDKYIGWDWRSAMYGDGVVIAILQQVATVSKNGYEIDEVLENLHSCGINAGISCFIAATYLHLSLIRHGSVFQIIDPWLTSWYCNFAVEMFARYLAKGYTVGEAYEKSISHVGIEYLTGKWWWDISENVCYYGDPCIRVWSPVYQWEKPEAIDLGEIGNHIT